MLLASTRTRIAEGEAPPQFLWIIHGGFLLLALLLLFGPQHLNRWRRA
jgi:hypothetical protein